MPLFSYTRSANLNKLLEQIESLRQRILLTSLSPKMELALQWETMMRRIHCSLSLAGNFLGKKEMIMLISQPSKRRLRRDQWEVIKYKKALEWINQNWLVNPKKVTADDILTLHNLSCYGRFRSSKKELKRFLDFTQTEQEHPIIQAAIAQIQLVSLRPFTDGNGRVGRLLTYLLLYRKAYDFRRLLVLEEYMRSDVTALKEAAQSALRSKNLTVWLEYFGRAVVSQLEKAIRDMDNATATIRRLDLPASFWELNDRQKEILTLLEQPGTSITNRKVKSIFKVSQITASRDLTKLKILGLLFAHGRGRSVYYTKV